MNPINMMILRLLIFWLQAGKAAIVYKQKICSLIVVSHPSTIRWPNCHADSIAPSTTCGLNPKHKFSWDQVSWSSMIPSGKASCLQSPTGV